MSALVDTVMGPLLRSRRPVLLVSPESPPAPAVLVRVAEHWGTPVITTPDRPNAFPTEHPLAGYHATFAWRDLTAAAVEQCDTVLMVGGAPSRFAVDGFLTGTKTFLQLCERSRDVSARPVPLGTVFGSVERTLLELCRTCPPRPAPRWFEQLKRQHDRAIVPETLRPSRPGTLHPAAAACVIAEELPPRACISVDVGEHAAFFLQNARLRTDHPTLIAIERSACMGHTFCASIGWGLASGRPTLALVGDGGFRMHSQEVHTAVEHGVRGWVAVVWENGGFGMVSHALDMQFGRGHGICSGAWRVQPDLAQLARGWGATACDVHDLAGLRAAIRCGFASPRPYVVVAHIDPTVEPPIRGRLKQLPDAVTTDA